MKILRENLKPGEVESEGARHIREVEELMRQNEIQIWSNGQLFVQIGKYEFRLHNGGTIPRLINDEVFELIN
jgi:hypothetical protein